MFEHKDELKALDSSQPLHEKLKIAHERVKQDYSFIARIAIALYDTQTRILKTFIHSSGGDQPLPHYQTLIDNAHSLTEILKIGRPRVVNNLVTFENSEKEHAVRIGRQGYRSSYTIPMFHNGEFFGFLFFNSYESDVFSEKVLSGLDIYGHLISLMVLTEISNIQILNAALRTSSNIAHVRDPETGSHLDRMSRYSRLIARHLAESHQLNDDYIEHVFMFSPLHDIGKIGIPDKILLKPGKLTDEESKIMRKHPQIGREMIEEILTNFGLDSMEGINILKNIAEFHHEKVNGSGYPSGIVGDEIPLEARIVAVADIFDALTSKRSYKKAWNNDDALALLTTMAEEELDKDCVQALIENLAEVKCIQEQFSENKYL